MRKAFLPIIISLCFLFESVFVEMLPAELFKSSSIFVPHFLMVAIIFVTVYISQKHGIMYGFIFGILFDIVYTEIIGIYLFMFPLVAYITSWIMRILQTNIILVSFVAILGVGFLELGVYEMNFLIGRTDMIFASFMDIRLVPTLILNLIFIILVSYPLRKYLDLYAEALRNE
ncbi:MAG TPA: rod shape-determining protein MreD [Bacillus sp. (in: firmicutes)]|nr:rod shape-determining protein MreD [Bacillus sp. (in: firmicutes)]